MRIDYGGSFTLMSAVLSFLVFLSMRFSEEYPVGRTYPMNRLCSDVVHYSGHPRLCISRWLSLASSSSSSSGSS